MNGKELAKAIRYALEAGAYDKKTGLRMIQQSWLDQKFAPILATLEAQDDIVKELREKVEALIVEAGKENESWMGIKPISHSIAEQTRIRGKIEAYSQVLAILTKATAKKEMMGEKA